MKLRNAKRLFDIAVRLQVYIEGVKVQQGLEFDAVLRDVELDFRKLLFRVDYKTLDGLSKAELNRLVLNLRLSQSKIFSLHTSKVIKQLQDFMQACLTVNRVAFTSAYIGLTKDEDDAEDVIMSDEDASVFIERENENNGFVALFGIAAILKGGSTLWPKIANSPIAANGALLAPFVKSFSTSAQLSLENIIRKGYANKWTPPQAAAEAKAQMGKIANQSDAVISTIMQHISTAVSAGVTSALFKKYRWVSIIDSGTTDICLSRNGKVYMYGSGPLPPAHIRCRSIAIPYNAAHDNETFYSWIKRQSDTTQNFALGSKAAALLRNGKLTSKDLVKLSNPTPITIARFKAAGIAIINGGTP